MALSIKLDTQEIPSILKMLGLGGMPAAADDTGGAPPVAASLGGEAQPTAAPGASQGQPEPDASAAPANTSESPASSVASTHDAAQPPTKLLRLQQALGTDTPVPTPPLQVPNQNGVPDASLPPADLAQSMANGTAKINPTFAERHPNIFKTLGAISNFAEDAGPGVGARTFGEGFAAAAAEPPKKAKEEADLAAAKANLAHTQAATEQMKSQVTLPNGLTVPFALAQKLYPTLLTEQGKNSRGQANIDSRESIAADKNSLALRKQGLKVDPATGKQVPLTRDEMSESEQTTLDLKQSLQDAAAARADMDRAKNDPNSAVYKAAAGRLQVAQKNAATASGRLGLAKDTFNANYFGTGPDGQALPGATTDANGNPIGPRMANAAKVPADRLKRGDLASNAIGNLDDIVGYIHSNPELFGSLQGRITTVREMMGSDDPSIRSVAIAAHNYALASAGVHGTRSQGAVESTENDLLNHWKDGPEAVLGGIVQAKKSLQHFVDNQQLGSKPIGSNQKVQPHATHIYNPATGTIAPVGR